jgi:hypothetical protein
MKYIYIKPIRNQVKKTVALLKDERSRIRADKKVLVKRKKLKENEENNKFSNKFENDVQLNLRLQEVVSSNKIILNKTDYENEYYKLDKITEINLINKAIDWMIQEGINPEDEGYNKVNKNEDEKNVDEIYSYIRNLIIDEIKPIEEYFKNYLGIEVKNIIKE